MDARATSGSTPIRLSPECPAAFWVPFQSRGGAPGTIESIVAEHRLTIVGAPIEALELEIFGVSVIVRLELC